MVPADVPALASLAQGSDVASVGKWVETAASLATGDIVSSYVRDRAQAPRRHDRVPPKRYFVEGHDGVPSSGRKTNRIEEHLAIALWGLGELAAPRRDHNVRLLDYQVPLKAHRDDAGVGKIDLFGLSGDVPVVIELKVAGAGARASDTPLRAVIEALGYAAIVEANTPSFESEIAERLGRGVNLARPRVLITGPAAYWKQWDERLSTADWQPTLCRFLLSLSGAIELEIGAWDLGNIEVEPGLNQTPPRLLGTVKTISVC